MLALPIQPKDALEGVIVPALQLCRRRMDSAEAELLLLAIAIQESGLAYRKQINGPARGLWQFELGGMRGVFSHQATSDDAKAIANRFEIGATPEAAYEAIATNDVLAACMARLLLWTDPKAMPAVGAVNDAWAYYKRNWRPGKPHPDRWETSYREAMKAVV